MDYLHQCLNDFTLFKWPYMVMQFKFTHPWSKCTLMCIHIWLNFWALKFTMNVNEFSNLPFVAIMWPTLFFQISLASCYMVRNQTQVVMVNKMDIKTHLKPINMFPLLLWWIKAPKYIHQCFAPRNHDGYIVMHWSLGDLVMSMACMQML
jgi:hypothetical protein